MKQQAYFDNIDIYDEFGVVITKKGYNNLLDFPALKEPVFNDWPEEDGIEVDLENPVLEARTITISFVVAKQGMDANDFISFLSRPGYHELYIPFLKQKWSIRMNAQSSNMISTGITNFSLQFTEDIIPRNENVDSETIFLLNIPDSGYEIDATPLNHYGIVVEEGLSELTKSPAVKSNLLQQYSFSDGQVYDPQQVVFSQKEVTFRCCLISENIDHFWKNYYAFFNDLVKPGERSLYCEHTGEEYPCYYRSCSNFNLEETTPRFVCGFDLTLAFISFRVNETDYILSTENNWHIVLEDNETRVDLKVNKN